MTTAISNILPTDFNIRNILKMIDENQLECYKFEGTDCYNCIIDKYIIILCRVYNETKEENYISYTITDDWGDIQMDEYFNEQDVLYPVLEECYEMIGSIATLSVVESEVPKKRPKKKSRRNSNNASTTIYYPIAVKSSKGSLNFKVREIGLNKFRAKAAGKKK